MTHSVIKIIENSIREGWDKPAFTDITTHTTFSYGDVALRIAYIHQLFEELGIKKGDKVALCDSNSCNWAISMLAIITYNAVAVPILPDFSDKQLIMLCEHSEAKFLIGKNRLAKLWKEGECPMFLLDSSDLLTVNPNRTTDELEERTFKAFAKKYPNDYTKEDVCYEAEDPTDTMLLSYTSGSTGNPKGVMLSYASLKSNNDFAHDVIKLPKSPNIFVILPMAHMFGFSFDFMLGISLTAHFYFLTKAPVPKILLEAFASIKPDLFLCVPLVMEKIINSKVLPVINTPRMKFMLKVPVLRQIICSKIRKQLILALGGKIYEVVMGGAALSKEVENVLRMVKFPYTIGYGMTECGPIITYADWKETRPNSCGKAVTNMTVKILSPDPENIPGEIVVKGVNVMQGYYKNQEATDEAIDEEGWLHTGDLGVMDKDGYLYIRGRKKNMLLGSNGQNVYPEEAEDQVVSHSIFEECVVVQRGEKLVALVYVTDLTLRAMGKKREELDLKAICKEINTHLPKYCQLAMLEQRDEEFEKTPKKSIRRFLYQ